MADRELHYSCYVIGPDRISTKVVVCCFQIKTMIIEQNSGDSVKTLKNVNHFIVAVLEYNWVNVPRTVETTRNFKIIATSYFSVIAKAGEELVIYIFRKALTMLLLMVPLLQLAFYGSTVRQQLDQARLNFCIFFM